MQIYQAVSEDADWQYLMQETGATMPDVILYFLRQSEILSEMLVNLAIGLVIGILGIVSARKQVSAYALSGQMPEAPAGIPVVPEQNAFVPTMSESDAPAAEAAAVSLESSPVSNETAAANVVSAPTSDTSSAE